MATTRGVVVTGTVVTMVVIEGDLGLQTMVVVTGTMLAVAKVAKVARVVVAAENPKKF